jgi:signal transduction histidine kinase
MNVTLSEALVRSMRHEIGDLLQKVYASIAILKDRLPPEQEMERGVLNRLWSRSEACRRNLDAAHDFICRTTLDYQPVDLAQTAVLLAAKAREKNPNLVVTAEGSPMAMVQADARRANQIGELLLTNACEAAKTRVNILTRLEANRQEVEWAITDDGGGVDRAQAEFLFRPFFTTRAGHSGLGLALAKKLVLLHGGRISAGNIPQGGFQVQIVFPLEPPAALNGPSGF